MVKHIIMLDLCLMVYIILNIGTVTVSPMSPAAAAREIQFRRLVACLKQMHANGLVQAMIYTHPNRPAPIGTFDSIMEYFYEGSIGGSVGGRTPDGVFILTSRYDEHFKDDPSFISYKAQLSNTFVDANTFADTILELFTNYPNVPYPLNKFMLKYDRNSNTEYLKTPKGFCTKYSEDPNAIANLR